MAEMFDGFDHTQYREEVERRWGKKAYADSAAWWDSKSPAERAEYHRAAAARARAWIELASTDASPEGSDAQELAAEHVVWLTSVPGTPAATADADELHRYVVGLAGMYTADERFAAHYGGAEGAAFVKAALEHYAETAL